MSESRRALLDAGMDIISSSLSNCICISSSSSGGSITVARPLPNAMTSSSGSEAKSEAVELLARYDLAWADLPCSRLTDGPGEASTDAAVSLLA